LKRLYPDHPVVGVGAIVTCKDRILLEKRGNDPGKGKWSIPGGVVELGESLEQTAIREVKEETNLTVDSPELIDVVSNAEPDESGRMKYHFVIIDYYLRLVGGTLKAGSDAAELRWVAFDEVEKYDLTKTFREFFVKNNDKLRMMSSGS
jgi:ADP-ribose pyrophosphatase YjhB (NUDIX family)